MLFNNIFNVHEFELYGRGIIIEPTSGCDCYFGNSCSREKSCMKDISVKDVLSNIAVLNKNLNNKDMNFDVIVLGSGPGGYVTAIRITIRT